MILSILYFLITPYLLSYWTDFLTTWEADIIETTVMRWGVGVATLIALTPFFNLTGIPLHYATYLLLGVALYATAAYQYDRDITLPGSKETWIYAGVFACFVLTAVMYYNGAYAYPYLENGDPWNYAAVINTIAEEQTYSAPFRYDHYSEPYTQGYQVFFAILHQLNNSVYHTMKVFHQAYLSLSIIFFFFLAKRLFASYTNSSLVAGFATFTLFVIPSWVSHFMFSLTFNMVQLLVFVYALIKTYDDATWWPITGVLLGSIIVTHQFTAVTTLILFGTILATRLAKGILPRHDWNAALLGGGIATVFYAPLLIKYNQYLTTPVKASFGRLEVVFEPLGRFAMTNPLLAATITTGALAVVAAYTWWNDRIQALLDEQWGWKAATTTFVLFTTSFFAFLLSDLVQLEGSASRAYGVADFFHASAQNMINNPYGWGVIIPFLVALGVGLLIKQRHTWQSHENYHAEILVSFLVFFVLTLGMYFPTYIAPFRMWTYLAIFTALIAGIALYSVYISAQQISQTVATTVIVVIGALLLLTTFLPKYQYNTAAWPEHRVQAGPSLDLHETLRSSYEESTVVSLCQDSAYLAGYDVNPPLFDQDINPSWRWPNATTPFHAKTQNMSAEEIASVLTDKNIDYAVGGASCADDRESLNDTQALLERLASSDALTVVEQTKTELLLRAS